MRVLVFGAIAIAVSVVSPAIAKDKAVDPDKKVCRREAVLGSIMPKTTCHTAAQWTEIDTRNSENAQTARDHMHVGSSSGG